MSSYTYLVFNLIVLIPVVVLSFITDVKPHKHWRALLGAFLLVSIPFILWDWWAATNGHWGFNAKNILDYRVLQLPLEELLFFVTVPFAMIYVWGVIKKFVADRAVSAWWPLLAVSIVAGVSVALLVLYWGNGYTRSAMIVTLIAIVVALCSKLFFTRRFWTFQIILLGIFVLANWFLTALPVITYGDSSIIGFRVITIPIEDFFFNFAFLNLFLIAFNWLDIRTRSISE